MNPTAGILALFFAAVLSVVAIAIYRRDVAKGRAQSEDPESTNQPRVWTRLPYVVAAIVVIIVGALLSK
jgi:hypothetical protein